jgi:hypothetical protein
MDELRLTIAHDYARNGRLVTIGSRLGAADRPESGGAPPPAPPERGASDAAPGEGHSGGPGCPCGFKARSGPPACPTCGSPMFFYTLVGDAFADESSYACPECGPPNRNAAVSDGSRLTCGGARCNRGRACQCYASAKRDQILREIEGPFPVAEAVMVFEVAGIVVAIRGNASRQRQEIAIAIPQTQEWLTVARARRLSLVLSAAADALEAYETNEEAQRIFRATGEG